MLDLNWASFWIYCFNPVAGDASLFAPSCVATQLESQNPCFLRLSCEQSAQVKFYVSVCVSVEYHYLLSMFSFLLGKKVGEEAVSLNPTCGDSHQW